MKITESDSIRNLAFVGHGDSGKTSLVSAILYSSGAVNRLGRIDDGTTVTDYEEDEIERKVSIHSSLAHCEWEKTKLNLIDTPGYRAFILDTKAVLVAADSVVVLVDGVAGVEVQTETVWEYADAFKLPRMIVINRLDRDRSSFERSLQSIQNLFGRQCVPVELPIGEEKQFNGVVDLLSEKAYIYQADGSGQFKEQPVPGALAEPVAQAREKLIEMIAESNDHLMEKFFESGTLQADDARAGLRTAMMSGAIVPVFCTSATLNVGVKQLMNALVALCPSPLQAPPRTATNPKAKQEVEVTPDNSGHPALFFFKTIADPFAGRISMFRVMTGTAKSDSTLYNVNREVAERLAVLQLLQGKAHESIAELKAGDIGAVLKLKETRTGETLCEKDHPLVFPAVELPEPAISFAVEPKSRADEDKIGQAMARLIEEDPAIRFDREAQTKEFLLSGTGQLHVETTVAKLKRKYGVEVTLRPPKVAYRETITAFADAHGRHKKQTGGHGQFGDCKIKMEPLERGKGFEFVDEVFGGSIPRNFIPAVEKGIVDAAQRGYLSGHPVVDFRVRLYDGSYHDVDSSEMAFKIAGSLAFKKGMEQARPVLLEPIMDVEIYAPENYSGDLMGDLNSRRGRVQGMDARGHTQIIRAQVPLAEMLSYSPVLTSMTQGRGSYHMEFSHYDPVPAHLSQKIIAEFKKDKEEDA
ncbi:MAG: elongation factor G [Acidobacteriota bacterium]